MGVLSPGRGRDFGPSADRPDSARLQALLRKPRAGSSIRAQRTGPDSLVARVSDRRQAALLLRRERDAGARARSPTRCVAARLLELRREGGGDRGFLCGEVVLFVRVGAPAVELAF